MFFDEIRQAAEAAPRVKLPEIAKVLWQAFAAGHVTEAEAETLSGLIETRKALPVAVKAPPRRVGSRPLTNDSLERRRRWAASGRLPPTIACRFTLGEQAVLAVVTLEVVERRDCRMPIGRIAALAGVGETTVRRALRAARDFGLVTIEQRRISMWRNDTNVVSVVSAEWQAWMRLPRGGEGGCHSRQGSNTAFLKRIAKRLLKEEKEATRSGAQPLTRGHGAGAGRTTVPDGPGHRHQPSVGC